MDRGKKVWCLVCGTWVFEEDTLSGVCDECAESLATQTQKFARKKSWDDDYS